MSWGWQSKEPAIKNWELEEQRIQGLRSGSRKYPINQLTCHWFSWVHSPHAQYVCARMCSAYSHVRPNGAKLSMSRHNEHLCIMWSEQYACVWKCVHNWSAVCKRTRCVWSFQIHQIMFSASMMKQNYCRPLTCRCHFDCWEFMCAQVFPCTRVWRCVAEEFP